MGNITQDLVYHLDATATTAATAITATAAATAITATATAMTTTIETFKVSIHVHFP